MDPEDSERYGQDTFQLYRYFLFFWVSKKKGWHLPPQPTPKSALTSASADVNIVIQGSYLGHGKPGKSWNFNIYFIFQAWKFMEN